MADAESLQTELRLPVGQAPRLQAVFQFLGQRDGGLRVAGLRQQPGLLHAQGKGPRRPLAQTAAGVFERIQRRGKIASGGCFPCFCTQAFRFIIRRRAAVHCRGAVFSVQPLTRSGVGKGLAVGKF